jgi:hypothetical protein
MSFKMSGIAIAFAVWGTLTSAVGALMAIARTNPEEVRSNLSKWAEWMGIHQTPAWFQLRSVDQLVFRWAARAFVVLLFIGAAFTYAIWSGIALPVPITSQVVTNSRQIIHIKSGEYFEDNDTADKLLLVETVQGNPSTIGLTKNPRIGQAITVNDKGGMAIYAPITVLGNGNKIIGLDKYTIQVDHLSVTFTYTGSDWIISE